jgi:predicted Zn-dependent protease
MIGLLEELKGALGSGTEPPAFLSSHPLTDDRIAHATARAEALGVPMQRHEQLDTLFAALKNN